MIGAKPTATNNIKTGRKMIEASVSGNDMDNIYTPKAIINTPATILTISALSRSFIFLQASCF
jgi:hypothetical protein